MPRWHISVPATTANLGPGFDQLGLALNLRLELEAQPADRFRVNMQGYGIDLLPRNHRNSIVAAYQLACSMLGWNLVPLELFVQNRIPIAGGLGSSASAIVAGVALAFVVHDQPFDRELAFLIAAEREGHPDNVAPAIFGGLRICGRGGDGFTAVPAAIDSRIHLILVTPPTRAKTDEMRAVLPKSLPLGSIASNQREVARLLAGLAFGEPELLRASEADLRHQPYRFKILTESNRIYQYLRQKSGVHGAFLSGSGPSVAGWVMDRAILPELTEDLSQHFPHAEVRGLSVDLEGTKANKIEEPSAEKGRET